MHDDTVLALGWRERGDCDVDELLWCSECQLHGGAARPLQIGTHRAAPAICGSALRSANGQLQRARVLLGCGSPAVPDVRRAQGGSRTIPLGTERALYFARLPSRLGEAPGCEAPNGEEEDERVAQGLPALWMGGHDCVSAPTGSQALRRLTCTEDTRKGITRALAAKLRRARRRCSGAYV